MADLSVGTVVAGCRIEAVAGRGGMGVVYRAVQVALDRTVALKVIAPEYAADDLFVTRFKSEARIAASIEHPNVVPVYEAGEAEGLLYLVMRFVEGTDLRELLDVTGRLDPQRGGRLIAQVASALGAAHRKGLVHRDVKPANVLITTGEGDEHAYLTDFGVAKALEATTGVTRTGALVGTPDYMAPERLEEGTGDGRADLYSLGCVLYQALTGQLPYPRENPMAKVFAHLNAPIPSASDANIDVPAALDEVAQKAMAKRVEDRFQGADEMREAILAAIAARPKEASAPVAVPPVPVTEALEPPEPPGATEPLVVSEPGGPPPGGPPPVDPPEAEQIPPDDEPLVEPLRAPGWLARTLGRGPAIVLGITALALAAIVGLAVTGSLERGGDPDDDGGGGAGPPVAADCTSPPPERTGPSAEVLYATEGLPSPEAKPDKAIPVGGTPTDVAVGSGAWITNSTSNNVSRIDARTRTPDETEVVVGDGPARVAVGTDDVWVTNRCSNTVSRISRKTRRRAAVPIDVGSEPTGIAAGNSIWVANAGSGTVSKIIEADSESEPTTIEVGGRPTAIAVGEEEGVFVSNLADDTIRRINPALGNQLSDTIRVAPDPESIAVGHGMVWVASRSTGHVQAIDPNTEQIVWDWEVAPDLRDIAVGPNGVWVTSYAADVAVKLSIEGDPKEMEPQLNAPVDVGRGPVAVAIGEENVWVVNQIDSTVTPIHR